MKHDDFMKKVVIIVLGFLLVFTIVCLVLFYLTGGTEPSVLIGSVFAACLGELSILGILKKTKNKDNTGREDETLEEER